MFGLIFSLAFVVVALLFMLVGALKGKKIAWQLSVSRIVMSAVCAIISALLASFIAWTVVGMLYDMLLGMMPDIGSIVGELKSGKDIFTAIVSMIIAPLVLFPLLYGILRPFFGIFAKLIAKPIIKLMDKQKEADAAPVPEDEDDSLMNKYSPESDEAEAEAEEYAEPAELSEEDMVSRYTQSEEAEELPKKTKKKKIYKLEKNSWVGALCGALCSFVTLCILLIPLVGFLGVINDVVSLPLQTMSDSETESSLPLPAALTSAIPVVADALDASASNAGSYTVTYLGGGLLYDAMTTYTVGDVKVTLSSETGLIKSIANAAIIATDKEADKEEKVEGIRQVAVAFEKTELVPILAAELTSAAAGDWTNGKDFHGIAMPSIGKNFDPIMLSLVDALSGSDRDTIKDDVSSLVEIVAVLMEEDALQSLTKNPMVILSKEDTTAKIMVNLLNNPRLCVLVDGLSDFGITVLMNVVKAKTELAPLYDDFESEIASANAGSVDELTVLYADIFDKYGLRVSQDKCREAATEKLGGGSINSWVKANVVADEADYVKKSEIATVDMITEGTATVTDKEKEAKALAKAYAMVSELTEKLTDSSFGVGDMVAEMGPVLDCFAATESIGPEKTGYILKAMLQSEMVHDKIGFTVLEASDSAASITKNAATKSYATMLNSLMLAVDMVEAASDPDVNTSESVNKLLDDLTPESAEVLSNTATPNMLNKYGVPEKSSEPTSALMGDTFNNLASAKENGMSDEDYAKESAAVSNMMSVIMTAGSGSVFGEQSSTGVSAEQFVDDIMDSQVMSDTIVDHVYGDGEEAVTDPLKSNRTMKDEERSSFIEALNNKWLASDKSEATKKGIISTASIMNVQVEVSDSAVTYVAPVVAE